MKEQRINIAIDEEMKKQVKAKAGLQGKSITQIVIKLLRRWLTQ